MAAFAIDMNVRNETRRCTKSEMREVRRGLQGTAGPSYTLEAERIILGNEAQSL